MKNKNSRRPPHCRSFAGNLFKREYKHYWIIASVLLILLVALFYFLFFNGPQVSFQPSAIDPLTSLSQCPNTGMYDAKEELKRSCTYLFDYLEQLQYSQNQQLNIVSGPSQGVPPVTSTIGPPLLFELFPGPGESPAPPGTTAPPPPPGGSGTGYISMASPPTSGALGI